MFEQMVIGDWLVSIIRGGVNHFITGRYDGLSTAMWWLMTSLLMLNLVYHGLAIATFNSTTNAKQMIVIVFLSTLLPAITHKDFYDHYIVQTIYHLKDALTAYVMIGDSSSSMYEAFSNTNSRMFAHASNILDEAGATDFRLIAVSLGIFIIYGIYYCLFVGVTLFAELTMGVLILLGCIVIPLSVFPTTRGLIKSWIQAIAKFVLMFVIIGFTVSLLNAISDILITELMEETYIARNGNLDDDAVNITSPVFGATLLIGVFGSYLMYQAMETAAELTGSSISDGKAGVTSIKNAATSAAKTMNYGNVGIKSGVKMMRK